MIGNRQTLIDGLEVMLAGLREGNFMPIRFSVEAYDVDEEGEAHSVEMAFHLVRTDSESLEYGDDDNGKEIKENLDRAVARANGKAEEPY